MCCLDFPGGCELRPRQLMASAKLGKRRCVEICELLETALDEAEGKAQKERMARLKVVNDNRPSSTTIAVDDNVETSDAMNTDHQTDKEEEEYRKIALDYSSGHFAASVKEDKDKKIEKNPRNEPSSLFSALLRSAQASSMNMETESTTTTATSDTAKDTVQQQQREEPTVEIIARGIRTTDDASKNETKEVSKQQPSVAADSEEEEEVVQLTSEFTTQLEPAADKTMQMDVESSPKQNDESQKASPAKKSTKPKSAVATEGEDDITDLSQALKKKKKKKKTKK